ncbi:hypothetical protein [Leucobacter sp. wl10]|uniref:hypothetical protein n=1 Tax=Leucobacter sp. wl10 TaxID=2304677 RepID=UPI001968D0D0|nr:hypothetical protein [Leucobacter sp. wl10]
MARTKLTDMLTGPGGDEARLRIVPDAAAAPLAPVPELPPEPTPETTAAAAAVPVEETLAPKKAVRSARPRRAPKARAAATPSVSDTVLPPYLRFARKETRLRDDQLTELTFRARRLNRMKAPDADRITDNTLIRVAVDLLLARADELDGGDEAALRRSLGLTLGERS